MQHHPKSPLDSGHPGDFPDLSITKSVSLCFRRLGYGLNLRTALHAKAKRDSAFRFYTLSDKVWRQDVVEGLGRRCAGTARPAAWTARRSRLSRSLAWSGGWGNLRESCARTATGRALCGRC